MVTKAVYKLGAKANPLDTPPASIKKIDCSGFARYAINYCTSQTIPDGSVNQHKWIKDNKFKESTVEDAKNDDGYIRIAFLEPDETGHGHVLLIFRGRTYESSSGTQGVGSRIWGSQSFMSKMKVYVLTDKQ